MRGNQDQSGSGGINSWGLASFRPEQESCGLGGVAVQGRLTVRGDGYAIAKSINASAKDIKRNSLD